MKTNTIWVKKFIFSHYGQILFGIVVTGIVGLLANYFIQNQIATREEKFEIYKLKLRTAEDTLTDTINIINSRLFFLQRIVWTYQDPEANYTYGDWTQYRKKIAKWNTQAMSYKIKPRIYFGGEMANNFIADSNSTKPNDNIYQSFASAHRDVLDWKTCLKNQCQSSQNKICTTNQCDQENKNTEKSLSLLRKNIEYFTERLYTEYYNKYLNSK